MKNISLNHMLPEIFSQNREVMESDIWNREIAFETGNTYLIQASSGKGKSSLLSYMLGYRDDFSGQLLFDGKDSRLLTRNEWSDLRRKEVGAVFQELRLFPELTSWENVQIKRKLTGYSSRKQLRSWFERLDIADKIDEKIQKMSFGQQQRVALIRALAQPFDFLLLDEPISHLDLENAKTLAELVAEEARERGAGIIVTSIGHTLPLDYEEIYKL